MSIRQRYSSVKKGRLLMKTTILALLIIAAPTLWVCSSEVRYQTRLKTEGVLLDNPSLHSIYTEYIGCSDKIHIFRDTEKIMFIDREEKKCVFTKSYSISRFEYILTTIVDDYLIVCTLKKDQIKWFDRISIKDPADIVHCVIQAHGDRQGAFCKTMGHFFAISSRNRVTIYNPTNCKIVYQQSAWSDKLVATENRLVRVNRDSLDVLFDARNPELGGKRIALTRSIECTYAFCVNGEYIGINEKVRNEKVNIDIWVDNIVNEDGVLVFEGKNSIGYRPIYCTKERIYLDSPISDDGDARGIEIVFFSTHDNRINSTGIFHYHWKRKFIGDDIIIYMNCDNELRYRCIGREDEVMLFHVPDGGMNVVTRSNIKIDYLNQYAFQCKRLMLGDVAWMAEVSDLSEYFTKVSENVLLIKKGTGLMHYDF